MRLNQEHTGGVPSSSIEYLLAPLVALFVLGLLVLVLRWAYGSRGARGGSPRPGSVGDHGLLTPMITVRDPQRASDLVRSLRDEGIRASLSGPPGRQLLLVWPTEVTRAAALLRKLTSGEH
jgi:hypothetical protein